MSFSRDTTAFRHNFTNDNKQYRLEMIPYSTSNIDAISYIDFPTGAIVTDTINFNAGFENNIRIGIKQASELTFTVQCDNFTSDYNDVLNWILERGANLSGDIDNPIVPDDHFTSEITNQWRLLRYNETTEIWEKMFIGCQLVTGDNAEIDINTSKSRIEYEVHCIDSTVNILAYNTIEDIDIEGTVPTEYVPGLYAIDFVAGGGNTLVDHQQIRLENKAENNNPISNDAIFPSCYKFRSVNSIFNRFNTILNRIARIKYRLFNYTYVAFELFNDISEIYDNYEFYKWLETYNASNKGSAIDYNNIVLLTETLNYDSETDTYESGQKFSSILGVSNLLEFLRGFCEIFLKFMKRDLNTYDNEKLFFCDIDDFTTDLITLTASDIVDGIKGTFLQNISAKQSFFFRNISDLDKIAEEKIENGSTLNQDAFQIDAIVDNFIPQIVSENVNDANRLVIPTGPPATQTGATAKSNTTKYNNLMYLKDYTPSTTVSTLLDTKLASSVCNVVKRNTDVYGDTLTNPAVYGQNINEGDAKKIRDFITEAQDNCGLALAYTDVLSTLYSPLNNPITFTTQIDMDAVSEKITKYGFDLVGLPVQIDYSDFTDLTLDLNDLGYIAKINNIDLGKSLLEVELIMNSRSV
jgi:hypothetical protein